MMDFEFLAFEPLSRFSGGNMDGEQAGGDGAVIGEELEERKDGKLYLEKFSLYETRTRFYVIGRNKKKSCYRILKIDRTDPDKLNIWEDSRSYSKVECKELLGMLLAGNMWDGGLKFVTSFYGIIGFVKFLGPHFMILITERKEIGIICSHKIYAVAKTVMISISTTSEAVPLDLMNADSRYKKILGSIDLTKDFFFSYSYRIMNSLQHNMCTTQTAYSTSTYNSMFVWNAFLTRGIRNILENTLWTVALVHGFFKQVKLCIFAEEVKLTLIARRSRFYAGTRYLKRGVNEKGRVANEVETEQIISKIGLGACPLRLTSVVQNRGSIPLYWSQETSLLNVRPKIELHRKDQQYEATKLHFKNLARRYGNPIIILSITKKHENKPRESLLQNEFAKAVNFINNDLPKENHLKYIPRDLREYGRDATKTLLSLVRLATQLLHLTGFFKGEMTSAPGLGDSSAPLALDTQNFTGTSDGEGGSNEDNEQSSFHFVQLHVQNGVLRTNCIDCLDRTNIAQFAYGLAAFGYQLHALDLIGVRKVDLNDQLAETLMKLYEDMGNTLALQYGGSGAHNKIFCEIRGRWRAATQSQEILKSIQRHCSNVYLDAQKQNAINVFLGYFQPQQGKPALWELDSDQHFNIGILSSFSDEISRPSIKRSLSLGSKLHEANNSPTICTKQTPCSEPYGAEQLDNEATELSMFDTTQSTTRSIPHTQFLKEGSIFGSGPWPSSSSSTFPGIDGNLSSMNSDDVEESSRVFSSFSSTETPSANAVRRGLSLPVPASSQNGFNDINGEKTMEAEDQASFKEFQHWIDNGGAFFG